MTCTAQTKAGSRCRRPSLTGREVCHAHSGAAVGRPPALTPEVHDRLIQATKAGAPDWVAAQSAGISTTTYYELLKRGRVEDSGPYRELIAAIERARGEAYLHAMIAWRREMATPGNWRAAVAYIDRVDRGRSSSPAPAGDGGNECGERLDLSRLSEDQLAYLEGLSPRAEERG